MGLQTKGNVMSETAALMEGRDTRPEEKTPNSDPLRQGSILVVDDEAGIRSFLHRSLAKHYPLVETAENVERAEALRQRCHRNNFV